MTKGVQKKVYLSIIIVVLAVGLYFNIHNVKDDYQLRDSDEAAWIFNSKFLDLYMDGDWKNPAWNEFDKYAQHPPVGKYLFGVLMKSIDKPVKDMEGRRFWFENDMSTVLNSKAFSAELIKRLDYKQVLAGRYMSAIFGFLTAACLMYLGIRLFSYAGGIASFILLLLHPVFRYAQSLCSGDTFIMFISFLAIIFSYEMCVKKRKIGRELLFVLALGIMLGLAFGSKISSYALILPVLIIPIIYSSDRKHLSLLLKMSLLSIIIGFLVVYLLDPGLHESPVFTLVQRILARVERVQIQKYVFIDHSFKSFTERLSFGVYSIYFSSSIPLIAFILTKVGFLFLLFSIFPFNKRNVAFCVLIFLFGVIFTVYFLQMAWPRYAAMNLPFMMLATASGTATLKNYFSSLRTSDKRKRLTGFVCIIVVMLYAWSSYLYFKPNERHLPTLATKDERIMAKMFAFSLARPGVDRRIHEILYNYFNGLGDKTWVKYEKLVLDTISQKDLKK